jgi:hypothetical protein
MHDLAVQNGAPAGKILGNGLRLRQRFKSLERIPATPTCAAGGIARLPTRANENSEAQSDERAVSAMRQNDAARVRLEISYACVHVEPGIPKRRWNGAQCALQDEASAPAAADYPARLLLSDPWLL